MRKEAEAIIGEDGWTKAGMQKMRKIDSFLKESQRLNSLSSSESIPSPARENLNYRSSSSAPEPKNTQRLDTLRRDTHSRWDIRRYRQ